MPKRAATDVLDIFAHDPPIDWDIESVTWETIPSTTSLPRGDGSPIELRIPGHDNQYIDTRSILLNIKCRVVHGDDKAMARSEKDSVVPACLWSHALWQSVEITLNQQSVTTPNKNWPYCAYLKALLQYSKEAQTTQLISAGFHRASPGEFDASDILPGEKGSLRERMAMIFGSKDCDMTVPLMVDVLQLPVFLQPNVEVGIKLYPSEPKFSLISRNANADYKIVINSVQVMVKRAEPTTAILNSITQKLSKTNSRYPFLDNEVRTFTIASGLSVIDRVIYTGPLPRRVTMFLVSQKAYHGDWTLSPFNMQHNLCTYTHLEVNGRTIPSKGLSTGFKDKQLSMAYYWLLSQLGIDLRRQGAPISMLEYLGGYSLYSYCISPSCGSAVSNGVTGELRARFVFDKDLAEPVVLVAVFEREKVLCIDHNGTVDVE